MTAADFTSTPPARRDVLFVYGTLRPALIHRAQADAPRDLIKCVPLLGTATVPGLLFDLGSYPGFVHHEPRAACDQETPAVVVGDLIEVTTDQLAVLDAYEECGGPSPLYRRERIEATRSQDGGSLDCWIYVYAHHTSRAALIPSGNYARHLAR